MVAGRLIIVSLWVWVGPTLARASSEPSLLVRAEKARARAEKELAEGRAVRRSARAERTQALQEALSHLAELRERRDELERRQALSQDELQRAESSAKQTARELSGLEATLRKAARIPESLEEETIEGFEARVRQGLELRLDELEAAMAARLFPAEVMDRRGRARRAQVVTIGPVSAVALGEDPSSTGLITETADGRRKVSGAPLSAEDRSALEAFVGARGIGPLPLDVDGALARRPRPDPGRLGWLASGGPFVWPILWVGLLGFVLLGERAVTLSRDRPDRALAQSVLRQLALGQSDAARSRVKAGSTSLQRVLEVGIETLDDGRERREEALESALLAEEPRLSRSLALIGAAAGVAPLLGLLGTVTGMIGTFDVISVHGTGDPRLLSGGISMALVTTQLGLLTAIPLSIGYAVASRAVQLRHVLLEEARSQLLGLGPAEASREEAS
ncbi:MAG: MotA/TolQ/ExbB proton channel family protein [Myxococcota bacterium]